MRRAGALVALLLAACTATPHQPAPTPAPEVSATVPVGGVSMRQLGFRYAPPGVSLPAGTRVVERVDLANNVTAVLDAPAGTSVAAWLRQHLPEAGFTITADGADSLLFHRMPWQGAFTVTDGLAAITLRTDREPA